MKLNPYKFEILNLPVDGFVVSKCEMSREQDSPLLSAINELRNSKLSSAEVEEVLLFYGLISQTEDDL